MRLPDKFPGEPGQRFPVTRFVDTNAARYDAEAAKLAWQRTVAFFGQHLQG